MNGKFGQTLKSLKIFMKLIAGLDLLLKSNIFLIDGFDPFQLQLF